MFLSEREPLGFINRLFRGDYSLEYHEFMIRLSNDQNQYVFCDHDIFQMFICALTHRPTEREILESSPYGKKNDS